MFLFPFPFLFIVIVIIIIIIIIMITSCFIESAATQRWFSACELSNYSDSCWRGEAIVDFIRVVSVFVDSTGITCDSVMVSATNTQLLLQSRTSVLKFCLVSKDQTKIRFDLKEVIRLTVCFNEINVDLSDAMLACWVAAVWRQQ